MTTPGYFELFPSARPALTAGRYDVTSRSLLSAMPPHGGAQTVPVDDSAFRIDVVAPRYVMPPDQILSTFPPAGSQGDWRERMPQIVLKRRTLPWERNPDPATEPAIAPPWLALVVLAEGEGFLSPDVDVAQCVSAEIQLDDDADVARGKYLEVTQDVIDKVFPCRDELDLLCHVRRVDLHDTELALGDDDGYLAVVLSSRLPQPAPPAAAGGPLRPQKYTAYLINLEKQLSVLLPTEPVPAYTFDATISFASAEFMTVAPNATIDQTAMMLGPGRTVSGLLAKGPGAGLGAGQQARLAPYGTATGIESAPASWAPGPARSAPKSSDDVQVAGGYKAGVNQGFIPLTLRYRFPVLVSWDFTCTAEGGFERLMNDLHVGLLGTLDASTPPPVPEVAPTGHVALAQRTRHGDAATAWYRGPLGPQPTQRQQPVSGVLPIAHSSDQLRKVVPDGREDVSLAALFEIGRLLALSKPTLVAALMQWRRDLFGAARARELANLLAGAVAADLGVQIIGGRASLEGLVRTRLVGAFTGLGPGDLAPVAREVTGARVPDELADLPGDEMLAGLGVDPSIVVPVARAAGPDGLAAIPLSVVAASAEPLSMDGAAMTRLTTQLTERVSRLTVDALKLTPVVDQGVETGAVRRSRRLDALDRLISQATRRSSPGSGHDGGGR
jgi:hypothetical protein